MVLDHEYCRVLDCTWHPCATKPQQSFAKRNEQIREDWKSGDWLVEELSYFWGLKRTVIAGIIRGRTVPIP